MFFWARRVVWLDFDGVVADKERAMAETAKKMFLFNLPPRLFYDSLAVDSGIMTLKQFQELQTATYCDPAVVLSMQPIEGSLWGINSLIRHGFDVRIITARKNHAFDLGLLWLNLHGISIPYYYGGGKNGKADLLNGALAFVDDDFHRNLEGHTFLVDHLFLFNNPWNEHIWPIPPVSRVYSWDELLWVLHHLP